MSMKEHIWYKDTSREYPVVFKDGQLLVVYNCTNCLCKKQKIFDPKKVVWNSQYLDQEGFTIKKEPTCEVTVMVPKLIKKVIVDTVINKEPMSPKSFEQILADRKLFHEKKREKEKQDKLVKKIGRPKGSVGKSKVKSVESKSDTQVGESKAIPKKRLFEVLSVEKVGSVENRVEDQDQEYNESKHYLGTAFITRKEGKAYMVLSTSMNYKFSDGSDFAYDYAERILEIKESEVLIKIKVYEKGKNPAKNRSSQKA